MPDEVSPPTTTPDFDTYIATAELTVVRIKDGGKTIGVGWSDGRESRYHAIWLRDNATDPKNLNPQTREQRTDVTALSPDVCAVAAEIGPSGALEVGWRGEDVVSRFDPGWLRAHDYSNPSTGDQTSPDIVTWDKATLFEPPTLAGAAILGDDGILEAALGAVASHGLVRLRGVETEDGMAGRVTERIGPVRETNFGRVFDVRVQPGPGSNAYSTTALTPHTDLPTREYQPGLQLLHCLRASRAGGRAIMVDGYRVAEAIRERDPRSFDSLTQIAWPCSNRALDTDYRWRSPVIRLGERGETLEIRATPFLRAPLDIAFGDVEEAYRSLRVFFETVNDPEFHLCFAYAPGDLIIMDNRRILHGREAYSRESEERWLQGCYSEREELMSRLRILARQRRLEKTAAE